MKQARFYYICGIDGSGKTTLANGLAQYIKEYRNVKAVNLSNESVMIKEMNSVCKKFGSTRWIEFSDFFRGMAWAIEMLNVSHKIVKKNLEADVPVIIDRYYVCNKVYTFLNSDEGIELINKIHDVLIKPDVIVYIQVLPSIANNRIEMRGEKRTPKETMSNLQLAYKRYNKILEEVQQGEGIEVIRVDGSQPKDVVLKTVCEELRKRGLL